MKFYKKITSMILLMVIIFSNVPTLAYETVNEINPQPFYLSFTGIVKELEDKNDGLIKVYLESKDGSPANFILSENTYYMNNLEIEVGSEITGYYESGKPMILIYPPQYSIDIVAPVLKDEFIKADKFDSDLLSKDKSLKLNISEDTEIVWENGTVMNWIKAPTVSELQIALSNRKLIVLYDFTTKSIPAQTTPKKIIVISQQEDDSILNIIVNGLELENKTSYVNENGITMVPVRAISEALGFKVSWNNTERSVQIGNDISLKIGENLYSNSKNSSLILEEAPKIISDRTFVPLSFFNKVLNLIEPYSIENKIIINSN